MQTWALIVDSFREARDKRLFWVMLLVSTLVGLSLACVGFDEQGWSLLFGAVHVPVPSEMQGVLDPAKVLAGVVSYVLVDTYIAWLGTVACLVATAGFIPNFLTSGGIDVVVSKPMSRVHVLLGKYVGSLSFVFVQAAYFVVLTLIVLRLQSGRWFWGYLWAVPLLVALFSYLYCVCTVLAIWSRSTLTSLMLTLLFWVSIAWIGAGDTWVTLSAKTKSVHEERLPKQSRDREGAGGGDNAEPILQRTGSPDPSPTRSKDGWQLTWADRGTVGSALHAMKLILPKTGDIPVLVARQMGAASVSDLARLFEFPGADPATSAELADPQLEKTLTQDMTPLKSVGSSLAFEAVVLAIACAMFRRKDF